MGAMRGCAPFACHERCLCSEPSATGLVGLIIATHSPTHPPTTNLPRSPWPPSTRSWPSALPAWTAWSLPRWTAPPTSTPTSMPRCSVKWGWGGLSSAMHPGMGFLRCDLERREWPFPARRRGAPSSGWPVVRAQPGGTIHPKACVDASGGPDQAAQGGRGLGLTGGWIPAPDLSPPPPPRAFFPAPQGFPTLLFFPAGKAQEAIPYTDERTLKVEGQRRRGPGGSGGFA